MKALAFLRTHAAVVWLATAALVVLGAASAYTMPSGIYPEVEFPRIVVVARSGGATPDVFLTTVTRPLEQTLTTVLGVQRIRSRTIRGSAEISLQFAPDTDMWRALSLTESRVNEARAGLPPGTEMLVERVTTGSFPVVTFNVSGHDDPRALRELAEFVIRPALANVPGVGRIEVLGGDIREVEVILDPEATAALHLTPGDVADRLRTGMGLRAVGRVERDRQLVTVIGDAQPKTLDDIREMPVVTTPSGNVVTLQSIAEVVDGAEDRTVRIGGPLGETVSVSVARLPGASTPDVVTRTAAAIDAIVPSLPEGVTIRPVYDQASLVEESMASVRDAIVVGVILCIVLISLFLRDTRAGLLAGLSIPITLAISFGAMRLAHQTLNLMSLGGMAIAIGLIVDDAIVILESIARHRDLGADAVTAATRGTLELAPAVIGTTLTTVVVFVPLAFMDGMIGNFFRALAFTLTTAVIVSLAVALVLVPLAAASRIGGHARPASRVSAGAHHARANPSAMTALYDRVVRRLLKRPIFAGAAFVLLVLIGVGIAPRLGRGFLPSLDEGAFVVDYFLPAGTSLDTTEQFARRLEDELRSTGDVWTFTRRTGAELGPAAATQVHRGDIMVRLVPASRRGRSSEDVMAELRAKIARDLPELRVEFVQVLQDALSDLAGNPRPLEVKIFGPDYAQLHALGDALATRLRDVPGLVDLYDGHEHDAPELRFLARRDAIARFGTTPDEVSLQLDTALRGAIVGFVRRYDRLVGIRARFPNPVRFDMDHVLDLPFVSQRHSTTFGAVSEPQATAAPSLLLHEALQPVVALTADHEQRDLGSIADDVEKVIADAKLPPGYRIVVGGQIDSQKATLRQLANVTAVALLLVLTVLAGQFRRLRVAALVLLSVPIAMVGAFVLLFATSTPLNASSLMGCVLLIGLVVKNGVLLLEAAETLVDGGAAPDVAVLQASERRLRPVIMTTVATLAGLLPLMLGLGSGAGLQRPLAIAVAGGLVTSTVATLVLLPPFFSLALGFGRSASHP